MVLCCSSRLFVLFKILSTIEAFGPRLESDPVGTVGRCSSAAMENRMVSHSHSNNDYDMLKINRQRYALHYENRYEEINGELFQSRLFISEPFLVNPFEFGIVNPFDSLLSSGNNFDVTDADESLSCGDECEECLIPDEYKHIDSPIDVMAYLGIRRAKRLQAPKVHADAGDWQ